MTATEVLRGCQAVEVAGAESRLVQCGDPGLLWTAPNGKSYVLCDVHLPTFEYR